MPVLITTYAIPQEASGTGIVLRRLVGNLRHDEAVVLGRAPNRRARLLGASLPVPTVRVRWLPLGLRGERFSRVAGVAPAVIQGLAAVRRHRCSAILAGFPDDGSLLTGYLLHRITGLPLMTYFCDLYLEDRRGTGWEARLSRWLQPRVFRAASSVLAVNRGMVDFYRERYGLESVPLPTCINQEIPPCEEPPSPGTPFRIGYSGNVNETREDSLRALVGAVGGNPGFSLKYFTSQSPAFLKSRGLWAENTEAEFVADETILVKRLMECDALFLPLTFEISAHSRDQMATCFGIKAYEYFLAQRPVLVHCPGDYFLARFFSDNRCGLVVDDPSPAALSAALGRLIREGGLRADLARGGLEAARQFEGPRVVAILRSEIARVTGGSAGGRQ